MTLDGITFLGRRIKPVALGLAIVMATLLIYNLFNIGIFKELFLGDIVSIAAAISLSTLIAGWWSGSQRLAEVGLFSAALVYICRTAFLLLTKPEAEGVALGFGIIVIAFGSWLLEKDESRRQKGAQPWSQS
jgi:hypothetical protein